LTKANELAPHTPEILLNLTQANFQLGRNAGALESMDESLDALTAASKDGSGAAAYSRAAEKVLTGLRQRNPHSFKVNYLLAEVHFLSNQYNEVLRDCQEISVSTPG
jgi:hypothetical protein